MLSTKRARFSTPLDSFPQKKSTSWKKEWSASLHLAILEIATASFLAFLFHLEFFLTMEHLTRTHAPFSHLTGGRTMQETACMPRSVLRHRPIHSDVQEFVVLSPRTTRGKPHHEPHTFGGLPSLARQVHPLIIIGLSMLITLFLISACQSVLAWGSSLVDMMHYGYPRTSQVDHTVGHEVENALSHFEGFNDHGQIYILEIPGGDASASQLLVGPRLFGSGADLALVVLVFQGDPRHPDLLVEVNAIQMRFHNTGKIYVPADAP
jgi:hypothetical protein